MAPGALDVRAAHIKVSQPGPTRQPVIYAVTSILAALTLIVVGFRIWARRIAKARFWWDDWCIWLGTVIVSEVNIATLYGASIGLGRHGYDIPPENTVTYLKILLSIMLTYMWAMSAIKASILLFYYRLFNINRALRWTVYFTLCFVLGWHVSYFFALIFQCTPVAYFWDRSIPGGHCVDHGALNNNTLSVSNSAFNVFTDLMCLIAPLPVLIKLRLSNDTVISVIRLAQLISGQTPDVTWSNSLPALWTVLELNIACICACLPGLMPVITCLFPSRHFLRDYSDRAPNGTINNPYAAGTRATASKGRRLSGFRRMESEWRTGGGSGGNSRAQRTVDIHGDAEECELEMKDRGGCDRSVESDEQRILEKGGALSNGRGILVTEEFEQRVDRTESLDQTEQSQWR
ncbi:hypothetical protein H2203_000094 [Taxawa tesnikishii (nom. ined.)]|nr:hypothetical protein H2203_000094 [Dothideales sp. JES 119]